MILQQEWNVRFKNETNQKLLKEINEFIANYYDEIRREVKGSALKITCQKH